MYREQIYDDGNCQLYLDVSEEGHLALHCDMNYMKKMDYLKYLEVLDALLVELKQKGAEVLYAPVTNDRSKRFATMFGFIPTHTFEGGTLLQMRIQ